jgi:uncharacterized membrane protein
VLLVYLGVPRQLPRRAAFEEVTVTPSELRVRQVSHRGEVREWTLNPSGTQLDRDEHEEFGCCSCSWCRAGAASGRRLSCAAGEGKLRAALSAALARPSAARHADGWYLESGIGWVRRLRPRWRAT